MDDDHLPVPYLTETTVEGHIETRLYQRQVLHKECMQPLHVVIIAKTNLRTQARAHVILLSSDLTLAYAPLVDDYGLRFQIAFNFRDAKQYWGLEDFMHITPTGVTHAANLSLFMVNVGLPSSSGRPCTRPGLQRPRPESRLSRLQVRGGNPKNASGKT